MPARTWAVGRLELALLLDLGTRRVVGLEGGADDGVVVDLARRRGSSVGVGRRAPRGSPKNVRYVARARVRARSGTRRPGRSTMKTVVAVVADVVDDLVLGEEAGEREARQPGASAETIQHVRT